MPQRLNAGALLAAVGGALLFVSLFMDWFGPDLTAWTVFEIVDLLLALAAIAAIAAAVAEFTGFIPLAPVDRSRRLAYVGFGSLILVTLALVNDPPSVFREAETQTGAWLGLIAALLMAVGGLLAAARISLVVTLGARHEPITDEGPMSAQAAFEEPPLDEPELDDPYAEQAAAPDALASAGNGETVVTEYPDGLETETRKLRTDERQ